MTVGYLKNALTVTKYRYVSARSAITSLKVTLPYAELVIATNLLKFFLWSKVYLVFLIPYKEELKMYLFLYYTS